MLVKNTNNRKSDREPSIPMSKAGPLGSLVVSAAGAGAYEGGLMSPDMRYSSYNTHSPLKNSFIHESTSAFEVTEGVFPVDSLSAYGRSSLDNHLELCEREAFLSDASPWEAMGARTTPSQTPIDRYQTETGKNAGGNVESPFYS